MTRKQLLPFWLGLFILVAISSTSSSVYAASIPQTCKQKVAKLNYRSALLEVYKKSENGKHEALHKKWATRISYAGQWVPKDAEKARESLYKYDALHAITEKEIDKQIQDYSYLKNSPLDCSKTDAKVLVAKFEDVRGIKDKKVVGGQSLIAQDKTNETVFLKKDFKKSTDSLINKLHKEKSKHPKPQHPKVEAR